MWNDRVARIGGVQSFAVRAGSRSGMKTTRFDARQSGAASAGASARRTAKSRDAKPFVPASTVHSSGVSSAAASADSVTAAGATVAPPRAVAVTVHGPIASPMLQKTPRSVAARPTRGISSRVRKRPNSMTTCRSFRTTTFVTSTRPGVPSARRDAGLAAHRPRRGCAAPSWPSTASAMVRPSQRPSRR